MKPPSNAPSAAPTPSSANPTRSSPSRSGVFSTQADGRVEAFCESISFDHRLYREDIAGSIAHATMLAAQSLITNAERDQIVEALRSIERDIDAGRIPFRIELEDIHMHIEHELIERTGDCGRKLHTARSRNDQVATDLRLWTRGALDRVDRLVIDLQRAFLGRCDADREVILPAYTHLQRAQPVLAPHYWLAYVEKLQRDRQRIADCRRRLNRCSLGVAAVAGTTLPIDRQATASALGFDSPTSNSLDTSSDRDFAVESAFVLAMIAEHLSGWAEEWILWSTTEFGFIQLPHAFCTGSSIMPQKVNPDTLELTRGKSARVIGNLQTLLVLIKGLPLAYNRDLQEDKLPLFDSFDTVSAMLEIAAPIVMGAELLRERIAARLEEGYLDATTLMEFLIKQGMPQRKAHHLIGAIVHEAMRRRVPLKQLPLEAFQQHAPEIDATIYGVLGVEQAIAAFSSYGSTGPEQVALQVKAWKERLTPG